MIRKTAYPDGPNFQLHAMIALTLAKQLLVTTPIHKIILLNLMFCVTVRHWYSNIHSQLDATVTNFY